MEEIYEIDNYYQIIDKQQILINLKSMMIDSLESRIQTLQDTIKVQEEHITALTHLIETNNLKRFL